MNSAKNYCLHSRKISTRATQQNSLRMFVQDRILWRLVWPESKSFEIWKRCFLLSSLISVFPLDVWRTTSMFSITKLRQKGNPWPIRRVLEDVGSLPGSMLPDNHLWNTTTSRTLSSVRRISSTGTRLRGQTTFSRISVSLVKVGSYFYMVLLFPSCDS